MYGYAQEVGRIFETELQKAVGEKDEWGLTAGSVIAMCGPPPVKPGKKGGEDGGIVVVGGGGADGGGGEGGINSSALVRVKDDSGLTYEIDQEAIKAMVETRAAQAIADANEARDDALAKLREERAARRGTRPFTPSHTVTPCFTQPCTRRFYSFNHSP